MKKNRYRKKKYGMPQALFTDMENSFNKTKEQFVCTPKEVAHYLGKSVSWVYKNQSELGVRKLGGSLFFRAAR